MSSHRLPDGRWHHTLRQSTIKTFDLCPERARFEMENDTWETDAASVGTATHAAIECCLSEQNDGEALDLGTTIDVFNDAFSDQMALPNFRWAKYDETKARQFGEHCTMQWHREVLPTLRPQALLETHFDVGLLDNEHRVIELHGTIDHIADGIARDWKTNGGRKYQEYEYKRWAIQPTVYTYALQFLDDCFLADDEISHFEYVVLGGKEVHRFTVERGPADWEWLKTKCEGIARLIEAELEAWPTNDTHALCSPLWCEKWSTCRGLALGPNPWNQELKAA